MLSITVQVASLTSRSEKDNLQLMRHANAAKYDYVLIKNERLTRFSSNETGVITAQVYADKIEEAHANSITGGNYYLLLRENHKTFTLMTVKGWLITRIDVLLEEQVSELEFNNKPIFTTEGSLFEARSGITHYQINELTTPELQETPHRLTDLESIQRKKTLAIGGGAIALVFLLWLLWPEQSSAPPPPPQKKIITIKMDKYHEYKQNISHAVEYHNIHQSLIAMTLAAFKLPIGWSIDAITLTNGQLVAEIENSNGQTQALKQFRKEDANGEFITIDGQQASFIFPIQTNDWFRWTKDIGDFVQERDSFMDEMIVMGAKVKSNKAFIAPLYTKQKMNITLEDVSLAYLDIFAHTMYDRPIFIDELTIRPLDSSLGKINIDITVTIVGR
ncbi:hypothetical protein [Vibrio sp. 1180_3]|uniref:hypothetical protein n=1 Tax=Vibrio sp. 1180_3 TaxID=2528832 RepID=UPI002406F03E|nr:hypothetical protein [Vibrio sp. 1180_3]MDF9399141.1 hypothetical protein [Vibrio sp. 1180_3]